MRIEKYIQNYKELYVSCDLTSGVFKRIRKKIKNIYNITKKRRKIINNWLILNKFYIFYSFAVLNN